MATLVQIRDVPDEVHRTLKARAARDGVYDAQYAGLAVRTSTGRGASLAILLRSFHPPL